MLSRFILLPFLIFTSFAVSAGIATAPAREAWALSTSDTISVNYLTKSANASVYLNAVDGTLYRATATTTSARLRVVAETALSGGKGNPWLTAAIVGAGLTYEGYNWYQNRLSEGPVDIGTCSANNAINVTLDECVAASIAAVESFKKSQTITESNVHTQITTTYAFSNFTATVEGATIYVSYDMGYYISYSNSSFSPESGTKSYPKAYNFAFYKTGTKIMTTKIKEQISDDVAASTILGLLVNADSSRQAFGENSQPYPLDGLFTNEDLEVDPTYSPSADLNTETLPDYITKYNNGLLQTTDPSKPNYVTPAQYDYIKSQANAQAAATAPGTSGATSTNPLKGMDQPITQKQYDESNTKTDEAAANQIKSTDWTGVDTASKGGDGANDALDKMAKGIDPTLPVLLAPDFPAYSSCRTIDLSWKGYSAVFPTQSQCVKMEEFKINFGYFLYLLTAVGIIFELLRRVD